MPRIAGPSRRSSLSRNSAALGARDWGTDVQGRTSRLGGEPGEAPATSPQRRYENQRTTTKAMPPTVPPVAKAAIAVNARSARTWRVVTLTLGCSMFTPVFLGAFHQRIATGS